MNPKTLENIVAVLQKMQELEQSLSVLYSACAAAWPQDAEFWESISRDEAKHADNLKRAAAIVQEHASSASVRRPFNTTAIQNVIANIQSYLAQINSGKMDRLKFFAVARDIEQTVLEAKGAEFLDCNNIEYISLMKEVSDGASGHKVQISQKIHLG